MCERVRVYGNGMLVGGRSSGRDWKWLLGREVMLHVAVARRRWGKVKRKGCVGVERLSWKGFRMGRLAEQRA